MRQEFDEATFRDGSASQRRSTLRSGAATAGTARSRVLSRRSRIHSVVSRGAGRAVSRRESNRLISCSRAMRAKPRPIEDWHAGHASELTGRRPIEDALGPVELARHVRGMVTDGPDGAAQRVMGDIRSKHARLNAGGLDDVQIGCPTRASRSSTSA